jgi:hypothetical protein
VHIQINPPLSPQDLKSPTFDSQSPFDNDINWNKADMSGRMGRRCFRLPPKKRREEWKPQSLSGRELVGILRNHFKELRDHPDGLHPSLKAWFDAVLELSAKDLLNHHMFYKTNVADENCNLHQGIQDWLEENLETLEKSCGDPRDGDDHYHILNELWDILNVAIFKGALPKGLCPWKFVAAEDTGWKDNKAGKNVLGDSLDGRYAGTHPNNVKSEIRIFEKPLRENYSSSRHIRRYLGTLLHEMVHSLISIYVCDCETCHKDPSNPDGKTGHGQGWAELAHIIEVFALDMLNIKLDLGVAESVAIELFETQQSADEWPLEKLGICPKELEDDLQWLRRFSQEKSS